MSRGCGESKSVSERGCPIALAHRPFGRAGAVRLLFFISFFSNANNCVMV